MSFTIYIMKSVVCKNHHHAIWFGVDDAKPSIMAKDTPEGGTGWRDYHIPKEVILNTRMHLSQKQLLRLLPILIKFAFTGKV
jgi:hypothetical protein